MLTSKQIDVIPDTNTGIVREVVEAMFHNNYGEYEALKTARYNYYRAEKNDFKSDLFIIFKFYGKIVEVEGQWYGRENDECWFDTYNWSVKVKNRSSDWDYEYISLDSLYSFVKSYKQLNFN
tara:strand:- start:579 stop:944 length:366 start_codon:yes stop_codon:yes gene_type:complete